MLPFCEVAETIYALTPFTKSSMLALPSTMASLVLLKMLAGIRLVSTNFKNPPKRKPFLVGYPYLEEHKLLSCGSGTRKGQRRISCNIVITGTFSMKHFREQPEDMNVIF
jgi:hypothetical protein